MNKLHTLEKGDLVRIKSKESGGSEWVHGNVGDIREFTSGFVIDCNKYQEAKEEYVSCGFNACDFAEFAHQEAQKKLEWGPNKEAVKYTRPFEPIFGKGRFSWCAAFVHWCLNNYNSKYSLGLPMRIEGHKYTLALCEQWDLWAKEEGWYIPKVEVRDRAQPGDLVLFDWGANGWEDHIGVFLSARSGSFVCAEGNVSNSTVVKVRSWKDVSGLIRISEGWLPKSNVEEVCGKIS